MADTTVKVLDPQTGKVEDLPGEAAQEAWLSGKRQLVRGSTVPMVGPDGETVMDADADKVADAIQAGWQFAKRGQVLAHDAENQQTRAFVEGAASGLTLGISDLIARGAGAEGLAERRATGGGQFGELAGGAASLAIPFLGEAGLAARGASASRQIGSQLLETALLPTMAVEAAGNAIERKATEALGRMVESEALARIGGAAAGRGVEGAIYGAGAGLSEEALGNPDINAESILAAVGGGALMGAGIGGGLGAGLRTFGEGVGKVGTALRGKAKLAMPNETELADGLTQMGIEVSPDNSMLGKFQRWMREEAPAAIGGYDPNDIRRVNSPQAQAWLREGKDVIEDSGRDLRQVFDAMSKEHRESASAAYGGLRDNALRDLIPRGNGGQQLGGVAEAIDGVRGQLLDVLENERAMGLGEGGGEKYVRAYLSALDDAEDRIFKKAGISRKFEERVTVEDPLYNREALLDQRRAMNPDVSDDVLGKDLPTSRSRQVVEQRTRSLNELASQYQIPDEVAQEAFTRLNKVKGLLRAPGKFGEEVSEDAQRQLRDAFQGAYKQIQDHLEDTAVWGEAGNLQRELNAAYGQRARAWEDLQKVLKFNGDEVDPASIASYLGKVDKLKGDRVTELIDQWQLANRRFAEVADSKFGASNGILSRAQRLDDQFSGVRKTIGEKVGVFNALNRLQARRNQVFSFSGGGVVNSLLGGALGSVFGLPGAVSAMVAQSIIDPGRTALLRANTAGTVRKVADYIAKRGEGLMDGVKPHLPTLAGTERQVSRATLRMLNAKNPEDRLEAYNERLAEIQQLSDPYVYGDHSARQMGEFGDALPAHAEAMNRTTTMALGMLAASLPRIRPGSTGDGIFDELTNNPQPHDRDVLKFAQVDRVLQDPLSIYDRVEQGYLFQHEVEALNRAYPGLAEQIRASVVNAAGKGKKRVPWIRQRAIGQLMGGPGTSYQKISTYQSIYQSQPQAGGGAPGPTAANNKAGVRTKQMQSTADRLENYPV